MKTKGATMAAVEAARSATAAAAAPPLPALDVIHRRAKGRTDKPSSKFTVPKKKVPKEGDSYDWAACLGQYLGRMKEELGKYQGRVFYTGRMGDWWASRNKEADVAHEIAKFLGKENWQDYTFHSFRRSSAMAAADASATPQQMQDFFGWKHPSMTAEYISMSRHQINAMADRLASVGEQGGKEGGSKKDKKKKKKKRKRENSSSSSSSSTSTTSSSSSKEEGEEMKKKIVKKGKKEKKVIINM